MKKIIFVRHGKAEEETDGISDFERSLTGKGKIISRQMASELKKHEKKPGIFISSPAFRALETALIFAGEFGIRPDDILMNSRLYLGPDLKNLIYILSELDDNINSIILFGHNPSFTYLADSLSEDGCEVIPKSGIAGIYMDASRWNNIQQKSGKTGYFLKP